MPKFGVFGHATLIADPVSERLEPAPERPEVTKRGMIPTWKVLNIKLHKTGPGNGFNEDEGRRFFTKQWDPLLPDLRKKMELE